MKKLGIVVASAALLVGCGSSRGDTAETVAKGTVTPSTSDVSTSDAQAIATPDGASQTSDASGPDLTVTPTSTPDQNAQWEQSGSAYRKNCEKGNREDEYLEQDETMVALHASFCQCAYEVLRDNLTFEEFEEYRLLHENWDEARFNLLTDATLKKQDACDLIYEEAIDWQYGEDTDTLTGELRVIAVNTSNHYDITNSFEAPLLIIECTNNSKLLVATFMAGALIFGDYRTDNKVRVAYRFGDGPVVESRWLEADEFRNELIVVPKSDELSFARSLLGGGELVFRAWEYDGSVVGTVTFNLTGSSRFVLAVLENCGHSAT